MISACPRLKRTSHPASHNCGIDRREYFANAGTRWARRALSGNKSKGSSPSWVEVISVPLGFAIFKGLVVGRRLDKGMSMATKLPVVPLSAIKLIGGRAGGPSFGTESSLLRLLANSSVRGEGSPRPYSFFLRAIMVQEPPIILSKVALVLCPSPGLLQVALVCLGLRPNP